MTGKAFKKKLIVTDCSEHVVWGTRKGKETVLYAIKATDTEGNTWEPHPLRSFAQLEVGVPVEYTCEPYRHKETGEQSITLKRPRHNTTEQIRHLEGRLDEAFSRIAALEKNAGAGQPGGLPDLPTAAWGT